MNFKGFISTTSPGFFSLSFSIKYKKKQIILLSYIFLGHVSISLCAPSEYDSGFQKTQREMRYIISENERKEKNTKMVKQKKNKSTEKKWNEYTYTHMCNAIVRETSTTMHTCNVYKVKKRKKMP